MVVGVNQIRNEIISRHIPTKFYSLAFFLLFFNFEIATEPTIIHYQTTMKKALTIAATILFTASGVMADIQAPPGSTYTSTRKLGRAISNILYGFMEIPEQIVRKNDEYGRKAAWSYGAVDGTRRAFKRLGYGFYELFTFHCPTFHGTFKPPYTRCGEDHRIEMNPSDGLSEFPPSLGAENFYHVRTQKW